MTLNGNCYSSCLGAGKSPQECLALCTSGVSSNSGGIAGGVPNTSSPPAGGSSPVYTQPPVTGTGVVATGTLMPLDYILIGLVVLVVAIIGVMLI